MTDSCVCSTCATHGMDKKATICAYLKEHHTGKSRAILSRDLQRLFSIDGRNLRRKISSADREKSAARNRGDAR